MSDEDDDLFEQWVEQGSGIATLERFAAPRGLCGKDGIYRLHPHLCRIRAQTDASAVAEWLADTATSDASYIAARGAIEKLMNWCAFERRVAISSLRRPDIVAFIAFLANPWPASTWICPRGVRRSDPRWRPFSAPLSPSSIQTVLKHCRSLFHWLGGKAYAHLVLLHTHTFVRQGFADQDDLGPPSGWAASHPYSEADWSWIEMQLADPGNDTSLPSRLALELQFFAAFKLQELKGLRVEHFVMPTPDTSVWRIYLPLACVGRTWVHALPPLSRTLDHWFGPGFVPGQEAGPHGGEPIFGCMRTLINGVRQLFARAAELAASHGYMASASRLSCYSSVALRRSFEYRAGSHFVLMAGFLANPELRSLPIAAYASRIELTTERIQQACLEFAPLWVRYPVLTPYGHAGTPAEIASARARVNLRFKAILARASARGEKPLPPTSPALAIYRSIDRYLRRHVTPNSHAMLIRWISSGDPMLIGREIWGSSKAQAAWAYLLWIFTIEPTVQRRRFRVSGLATASRGWCVVFHAESFAQAFALDRREAVRIHDSAPLVGAALLQAWHAAMQAARSMAARRLASWGPGTLRLDPAAQTVDERFLEERPKDLLGGTVRPSKQRRLQQRADDFARRSEELDKFFGDPCLLFDGTDWNVSPEPTTDAPTVSKPAALCFVKARLFGIPGQPRVILRRSADGWTARLIVQPIQVSGDSERACFALLREACRQFLKGRSTAWKVDAEIETGGIVRRTSLIEYARCATSRRHVRYLRFWASGPSLAEDCGRAERLEADHRARALPPPTVDNA